MVYASATVCPAPIHIVETLKRETRRW